MGAFLLRISLVFYRWILDDVRPYLWGKTKDFGRFLKRCLWIIGYWLYDDVRPYTKKKAEGFGSWVYNLVKNNKAWALFMVAMVGVFFSSFHWAYLLIAALLLVVALKKVAVVTDFFSKIFVSIFTFMLKVMTGQSAGGVKTALIVNGVIFTAVGFAVGNEKIVTFAALAVIAGIIWGVGGLSERFKFFK